VDVVGESQLSKELKTSTWSVLGAKDVHIDDFNASVPGFICDRPAPV